MYLKARLAAMNFIEFAAWGAYLISMGAYLGGVGMAGDIGLFYAVQGVVSIFMPALMGIVADRWVPAQRLLGLCHLGAGLSMLAASAYAIGAGGEVSFATLFTLYTAGVAFYMPTLALSNSVAYTALARAGLDSVAHFPPIRVLGTVGFIVTMWVVDLCGFQQSAWQFAVSGAVSIGMFAYSFTLPPCPVAGAGKRGGGLAEAFGLQAFSLFRRPEMAVFFLFSMLLGVSLQITNGYANLFITSFGSLPEYAGAFGVDHANILISLSQVSETCCILLIPFFMKRFGIKAVMLIAMTAWALRFALLGAGNPGPGVWMFIASMVVYGVAFDFFNVSGSLFVDASVPPALRSSAQGLFMLMTNGLGASIGMLCAQAVVDSHTAAGVTDWTACWYTFAAYALVVGVAFAAVFRPGKETGAV